MKPRIPPHFGHSHNERPIEHSEYARLVFADQARNEKAAHPRANKARKAAPENKSTEPA